MEPQVLPSYYKHMSLESLLALKWSLDIDDRPKQLQDEIDRRVESDLRSDAIPVWPPEKR